jgi:hypothetical protein
LQNDGASPDLEGPGLTVVTDISVLDVEVTIIARNGAEEKEDDDDLSWWQCD